MKSIVVVLALALIPIALATQAIAQIRTPNQDFFEQGRNQLEEQIQILQGEQIHSEENPQSADSEPVLEIKPSPSPDSTPTPDLMPGETETPSQDPNSVFNNRPQN